METTTRQRRQQLATSRWTPATVSLFADRRGLLRQRIRLRWPDLLCRSPDSPDLRPVLAFTTDPVYRIGGLVEWQHAAARV